jgi:ELWxxDGT repeat protein
VGRHRRPLALESLETRRLLAVDVKLLRDLTGNSSSSFPSAITAVGNGVYFTATTSFGTELWHSNGTGPGTVLVKDIRSGSSSSNPIYLTNVGGKLFFSANDGVHGNELWMSDGTTAGTQMVKEINKLSSGSNPGSLTNVNGTLFFTAYNGTSRELWKSDGTFAGTTMVRDIGPGDANAYYLTNVGGKLYFQANDGTHGSEIWKSDGTFAGTTMVKDLVAGSAGSFPSQFTEMKGTVYFRGQHDTELWRTNGTAAGTVRLRDSTGLPIDELTNFNGTLLFTADSGTQRNLWKSNGTVLGTKVVYGIDASNLTEFNGKLFFTGKNDAYGSELWRSDGTSAGTWLVYDIKKEANYYYGNTYDSNPAELTNVNGTLLFSADDGDLTGHGRELWKSDGTWKGTVLLSDISAGNDSGGPADLVNVGGTLYFTAQTAPNGNELWTASVNADPTVTLPTTTAAIYRENDPPTVLAADAVVGDLDGTSFAGFKINVRVSTNPDPNDRISIAGISNDPGKVNVSGTDVLYAGKKIGTFALGANGNVLTVTFNASANLISIQAVTRRIAFATLGDNPSVKPRTIRFQATDSGGAVSIAAFKNLNVVAVNDPPAIAGISGSVGYQRGAPSIAIASNAGVTDPDAVTLAPGKLTIAITKGDDTANRLEFSGPFTVVNNDLRYNDQSIGTIIGTGFGAADLAVRFNLPATVGVVQLLVRSVRFRTLSSAAVGERDIAFTLTDSNGGVSNTAVKIVNVS